MCRLAGQQYGRCCRFYSAAGQIQGASVLCRPHHWVYREDPPSSSQLIPTKSYQVVFTSLVCPFVVASSFTELSLGTQGTSVLSYCLAHRLPPLSDWRAWVNLTWGRLCVVLVLFDSCVFSNPLRNWSDSPRIAGFLSSSVSNMFPGITGLI
jgi:hypothetical protein